MPEAAFVQCGDVVDWTADAAHSAGAVVQLPDGRAGVVTVSVTAGQVVGVYVGGIHRVAKTTSMVVLVGSRLFWDHSANKAHLLHRADRDFSLGVAMEDATSSADTVLVNLNAEPVYTVDLVHGFATIPINTAGFPFVHGNNRGVNLGFSTTAEAQKVDALSIRSAAPAGIAIVDALICINTNGDAAAVDINVGLASATHATDADAIAESLFVHVDGASTNIYLESDDATTEVAATDSTVDFTAGTPFLVQFDLRNRADIQAYIDGVNVLPATVFRLDNATGPLKVLAHMEKTSDDSPGNVSVLLLGARTIQQ